MLDITVLEGVIDGTHCPICEQRIKKQRQGNLYDILDCYCSRDAADSRQLMELMDWAREALEVHLPQPADSKAQVREKTKNVRAIQASARSLLNQRTRPDSVATVINRTDIFGRQCVETITDRRDLHDAITAYSS